MGKLIDEIFIMIEWDEHPKGSSVEEALQKALDSTTPDRPGVPWEERVVEDAD